MNIQESNLENKDLLNSYKIDNEITLDDAKEISKRIQQENLENGKHMLEKSAEEILKQATNNNTCIMKSGDKVIGFITTMKIHHNGIELLESGSIIVDKLHQNQGIGTLLKRKLLEKIDSKGDIPLYSVSNQGTMEKINSKLDLKKYTKQELPNVILNVIESQGKLLEDDTIYVNDNLFYILNSYKG